MAIVSAVEAFNDRLARSFPIDDYYSSAPLLVRFIERRRLDMCVTDRRAAPHDLLPIRACFRCVRR
jgi:hypothetical protein